VHLLAGGAEVSRGIGKVTRAAQRLGAELRSQNDSMLDQIPTEVTKHCKAPTDGVSSSELLGGVQILWPGRVVEFEFVGYGKRFALQMSYILLD